jgi:hypothetical protein
MGIKNVFAEFFATVRRINEKYAHPALKTSKGVKFSLFCLRIYLILLIGLLFFKFYMSLNN